MGNHDIIVVGGSAGGVESVSALVAGLPRNLPAAVFVVVHFPPWGTSVLPRVLARAGALPVQHALAREPIRIGRIYVAPPDRHLLVDVGWVRTERGPPEHRNRPAIDPLFRSAAAAFGPRVAGVLLSGNLDDGVSGLIAIHEHGGVTFVQAPASALYPSMPQAALDRATVDGVGRPDELAQMLTDLVRTPQTTGP